MAGYPPTPPPTSSPKSGKTPASYRSSEPKLPAQGTYFEQSYSEPKLPAQDTYFQQSNSQPKLPAQDTYFQQSYPETKLPAQETYFQQSYSTPASPTHWDPSSKPVPTNNINAASTVQFDTPPPRRRSSPIQYQQQQIPYEPFPRPSSAGVSPNTFPNTFRPPRKSSRTPPPRPLYSSPLNPLPTPYNASRPQPRPGLVKQILGKIEQWIRSFKRWSTKSPIKAGLLTFIPVLATAGIMRAAKGIRKVFGGETGGLGRLGKGGGVKGLEKEAKKEWGYGLDEFVGFAGAKGKDGPVAGLLKVLQMLVNHYCKLTPSSFPRVASILLELYFLEAGKTKL